MKFEVPYYSYADIGKVTQVFLSEHHPSLELPIPIEKIVDVKLGLNIFPFPRLYKDHKLNGFLSDDRKTIHVDEYQYEQFNEKYRYTLAHEIGHYVLHQSCYGNLPFMSPDEYVEWRLSLPPEDIEWFEKHGDWFAEQVLVPTVHLEEVSRMVVDKHKATFSKMESIPDDIWSYISNEIARHFEVNPPVVEIRIKREGIPAKVPIGDGSG